MGAFSVFCQYHTRPELLFDVPPECFPARPQGHFLRAAHGALPAAAGGGRRGPTSSGWSGPPSPSGERTLVNSLSASLGGPLSKEEISSAVSGCGLPENIRGERLSISDFAALSKALRRAEG